MPYGKTPMKMQGGHAIHKHMSNSAFMKKETIKQEKTNLLGQMPVDDKASALEMVSPLEFHEGVPHPPKRSMLSEAKELPKSKAKELPKKQLNEMLPTRNNMLSEAKELPKKQLNEMLPTKNNMLKAR